MTSAFILVFVLSVMVAGTMGYFLGRYQARLINEIRTLTEQSRQAPEPDPEKPTVIVSAYQTPKEISTSVDTKRKAGLVEAKTPQRLDWEFRNELADLEHN